MGKLALWCCFIIAQVVVCDAQTIVNISKDKFLSVETAVASFSEGNQYIPIEDIIKNEKNYPFKVSEQKSIGAFKSNRIWLKFIVNNATEERAYLDFNPSLADSISVYHVDAQGQLQKVETGLGFKFNERGINHFNQNVELKGAKNTPQIYYARLVTTFPINYKLRIGTEHLFMYKYQKDSTMWGVFMGVLLFIIGVGVYIHIVLKLHRNVYFLIYLMSMLGIVALYNGMFHQYLFYDTPQYNHWSFIIRCFPQIFVAAFTLTFLQLHIYSKIHNIILKGIVILLIINTLFSLYNIELSFILFQITSLPVTLYSIFLAYRVYTKGHKEAIYYFIGWMVQPMSIIVYQLSNLGILSGAYQSVYLTYASILIEALLITLAFMHQFRAANVAKEEAQSLFIKSMNDKQEYINAQNQHLEQVVNDLRKEFEFSLQREREKEELLVKNNRELNEFASIVSHDLRAPLRNINSFTQILLKRNQNKFDEKDKEYIQFITAGVKLSSQLIEDLLNYSRMDKNIGDPERLDLNDVVLQILNSNNNYLGEKNTSLDISELPVVEGHKSLLVLIWQNLILNAIKYNESATPEIAVGCNLENNEWVYFVKDNGIGISLQYQEEIFRMFRRLHTHDKYEGTGIGLAFCKRIVEFYEGRIWFESEIGQGTTFYFTLPKIKCDASNPSKAQKIPDALFAAA